MKTSVIIPSYNRPELLQEAIESVWAQTCLPDEIIIGDDSSNDDTERLVNENLIHKGSVSIKYFHHKPALKQTKNVDFLMKEAAFDFLLLLHDDDLLVPNCIELLKEPLLNYPNVVASFGNQFLIKENGSIIKDSDKQLNEKYYRTPNRVGLVDGQWAASVQMLPNDAFLMRTKVAQQIRYYDEGRAGDAVDFYFGFRLGKDRLFYWINEVTSKYRVGQPSITSLGSVECMSCIVKILLEDLNSNMLKSLEIEKKIKELMNPAISEAIRRGDKKTAMKWMFSSYYNVLTLKGFKRLVMLINPF